jgi:hypothetical protein
VELRALVERAFANRPYPGDDRIAESDPRYPDYEGDRVSAFFRGKDWRHVTFGALLGGYRGDPTACLLFMLDDGFRYYLPAFLLMALDPEAREISEPLCFTLTDRGASAGQDFSRFQARVARLSAEEKAAVTEVLRHLADQYDRAGDPDNPARHALDSYWEPAAPQGT